MSHVVKGKGSKSWKEEKVFEFLPKVMKELENIVKEFGEREVDEYPWDYRSKDRKTFKTREAGALFNGKSWKIGSKKHTKYSRKFVMKKK
jgi:hypothetical protein